MKRIALVAAALFAGTMSLPAAAHSDVAVRVNLGLPTAVVYYSDGYYAPRYVRYYDSYRPTVVYRDGYRHYRHDDRYAEGRHRHHHDRHCRH